MLAETTMPIYLDLKDKLLSFPSSNAFLLENRSKAMHNLAALDLPTRRDEYWKYTRLAKTFKRSFNQKSSNISIKAKALETTANPSIALVNGAFDELNSSTIESDQLVVLPLSSAAEKYPDIIKAYWSKGIQREKQYLDELTEAFYEEGFFIWAKAAAKEKLRVEVILHTENNQSINAYRNLIVVEKSADLNVMITESSSENNQSLNLMLQENFVAENAILKQCFFQKESLKTERIDTNYTVQQKDSFYKQTQICLGNQLLRNNIDIAHLGENANTKLYGLIASEENQHIDNHSHMDHQSPNCESTELFKGIYGGKSTAVFNGKVTVRQDAQKINAYQSSQNILLSDTATINSKPELEIYADDVKCSHGSTTGQLDEDAMFYLRARGIPKQKAKNLLVRAFLNEVIEQIEDVLVEEEVNELLDAKLK